MRLTSFTDYGLRALMRLAGEPDRSFTTDELAGELRISRNHLAKVVQELARAGYLKAQRGAGGGLRLSRAPDAISLGEIVRLLERRHAIVECFRADGGGCTLTAACRLRSKLAAAREAFLRTLDATALAECAHPGPRATLAVDTRTT
jgi:Rrf2 family nitric oxide-sensitive transcriptional repressor